MKIKSILILCLLNFTSLPTFSISFYQSYSTIVIDNKVETSILKDINILIHNHIKTQNSKLIVFYPNTESQATESYLKNTVIQNNFCDSLFYIRFEWIGNSFEEIRVYSICPIYLGGKQNGNNLTPLYDVDPLNLKQILKPDVYKQMIQEINNKITILFKNTNKSIALNLSYSRLNISKDSTYFMMVTQMNNIGDFVQASTKKLMIILNKHLHEDIFAYTNTSFSDKIEFRKAIPLFYSSSLIDTIPDKLPSNLLYDVILLPSNSNMPNTLTYSIRIIGIGFKYDNSESIWFKESDLLTLLVNEEVQYKYSLLKDVLINSLVSSVGADCDIN